MSSLTENREARRLLDTVYDGGAVKTCLENGYWNFGTRSVKIENDPTVDPDFGFQKGFAKPSDWCRTAKVSTSEYFRPPLMDDQFADESGYWFADIDTLYVRFVSNLDAFGGGLGNWTESFARYFEAYLADRIAWKLTRDKDTLKEIQKELEKRHKGAISKDAQDSGTSTPVEGAWNRARRSRQGAFGRRDGGTRNSLVG